MRLDPDLLQPFEQRDARRTAVQVHDVLREHILCGRLSPGTVLSQVQIAQALQVSRTPVREAMRMLQEGGLISSDANLRSHVLGFDPADIESLYIKRIVLEAFGVYVTTRTMTTETHSGLEGLIEAIEGHESHGNFGVWQRLHRELHSLMVSGAGAPYVADLREFERRSARYQSAYRGDRLDGWWQRQAEHRTLVEAMVAGHAELASSLAAKHLARTALSVLAALAPEYDSSRLRGSLNFATFPANGR